MKKLLIAEDHLITQNLLKTILEQEYTLSFALNGEQALRIIERDIPDMILMDVMMPVMDGISAIKKIRKEHSISILPILVLSGAYANETVIEALRIGANDYIKKPFRKFAE